MSKKCKGEKIKTKLNDWLKRNGYKMVSVEQYRKIHGLSKSGVYKRIESNNVEFVQVDGTKILLIKEHERT